jgi:hypothetical protein
MASFQGQNCMANNPQLLRIFISYAHEDLPIAAAVAKCLRVALGNAFAIVNIDQSCLEAGSDYRDQLKKRLAESDIFLSLYTGRDKQWPEWEIGYFEGLMGDGKRDRKLVPIYFKKPPATIEHYQGLDLGVPPEHLQCTIEQFRELVRRIDGHHPVCQFVASRQDVVDELRRKANFPAVPREPEQDAVVCVQNMMLEIFNHLRASIQVTFKPQKQILIRTTDAELQDGREELPLGARIIPVGEGDPMSIFGLTNIERSWETFLREVSHDEHLEAWRTAIVSVITSSLDNRINVDNSQLIVSSSGEKAYRVILTSALTYYDGKREFNVYFVETLPRGEYGDRHTTLLLKAIELTCRFRFMFFEKGSEFSHTSINLMRPESLPAIAARLTRELNILRKDAREAGLDQPAVWLELVEQPDFPDMVKFYQPIERLIRETAAEILEARGNEQRLVELRGKLIQELTELEAQAAVGNARLIRHMSSRLEIVTSVP